MCVSSHVTFPIQRIAELHYNLVVKKVAYLIIIVATVIFASNNARPFSRVCADKIDLIIVEYLVVLVRGQLVHVQLHHLLRRRHHCLGLQGGAGTCI